MVRARSRIAIWLAWFVVLNVVWLALVATLNWQEEIAGVISAAIGATARRERVRGRFVCERYPHAGEDPADEARRALYKIEASIAPNTYVVGYDDDTGAMLLHQLVE